MGASQPFVFNCRAHRHCHMIRPTAVRKHRQHILYVLTCYSKWWKAVLFVLVFSFGIPRRRRVCTLMFVHPGLLRGAPAMATLMWVPHRFFHDLFGYTSSSLQLVYVASVIKNVMSNVIDTDSMGYTY